MQYGSVFSRKYDKNCIVIWQPAKPFSHWLKLPTTALFCFLFCLFCCFTSHVNSYGHCGTVSSPNHTFSWAGLNKRLTSIRAHTFACNWQQPFLNESAEGRRMTVEIISWSISTKVWDRTGIELATPGSAVRHASVTRHVTDCATRPGTTALY